VASPAGVIGAFVRPHPYLPLIRDLSGTDGNL
jgi:hypothetical protein